MANSATTHVLEQTETRATAPRIAVAGIGGYAGGELARLLLHHPRLRGTKPSFLGRAGEAETGTAVYLEDLHPQLATPGDHKAHEILPFSWEQLAESGTESRRLRSIPQNASRKEPERQDQLVKRQPS